MAGEDWIDLGDSGWTDSSSVQKERAGEIVAAKLSKILSRISSEFASKTVFAYVVLHGVRAGAGSKA
jgi:hypothetical protein